MTEDRITGRLQELVDRLAKGKQIHNMVVGIRSSDGRIDATAVAGFADAGGSVAMTTDTPYYLASITKMYTATVVMSLVGAGRIDLDAPISNYLAGDLLEGIHVIDGTDHGGGISVSQLLSQTSGLADYFEGKPKGGASLFDELKAGRDRELSLGQILEIVRGLRPEFAPGAAGGGKARYSDTNFALLGGIIEAVTVATVADSFQELIFTPLGLDDTYVAGDGHVQTPPSVFYFKEKAVEIPLAMSSFAPDGGVVSTLADSLRFLRGVFGGELLTKDQLAFMTSRWNRIFFPLEYGSGLMRFKPPRWMSPFQAPPELVGHSGSTGSFAFYNPDRDLFISGTLNQMDNPSRPYRFMPRVLDLAD